MHCPETLNLNFFLLSTGRGYICDGHGDGPAVC